MQKAITAHGRMHPLARKACQCQIPALAHAVEVGRGCKVPATSAQGNAGQLVSDVLKLEVVACCRRASLTETGRKPSPVCHQLHPFAGRKVADRRPQANQALVKTLAL